MNKLMKTLWILWLPFLYLILFSWTSLPPCLYFMSLWITSYAFFRWFLGVAGCANIGWIVAVDCVSQLTPRKWLENSKWPLLGIPGRQWGILMQPLGSKTQAVLPKRVHYNPSSHCVHFFPFTENWIHDNNTLLYGTVQYKGKVWQYNTSSIQSFHKCCAVFRNARSGRPGEQQRNCDESC